MADDVDDEGPADGPVAAPVAIGYVRAKERHGVLPELVEGGQACRCSLAHAKGTGFPFGVWVGSRRGGESLLDEVGEDRRGSIVRKALAQLDEGDGVDVPGDLLGHTAEGMEFLLGRGPVVAVAIEGGFVVGRGSRFGQLDFTAFIFAGGLDDLGAEGDVFGVGRHGHGGRRSSSKASNTMSWQRKRL